MPGIQIKVLIKEDQLSKSRVRASEKFDLARQWLNAKELDIVSSYRITECVISIIG